MLSAISMIFGLSWIFLVLAFGWLILMLLGPRFWDSPRIGQISPKFAHFGWTRANTEPAKKIQPILNL